MAFNPADLSNDEIFYSYLDEHLDGALPSAVKGRFQEMLKGREQAVEFYQTSRGRFQVACGEVLAPEPLRHKLRNLIQDDQARETIEASEIADIERSEFWSNVVRRSVLTLAGLGIVGGLVYMFMPNTKTKFNVVEYVGYEAVALEEDPDGRINLPTTDLEEVKQFIATVPGLTYKPQALRPLKGWLPEGVSIIDYDVMKVVAVVYRSPERNNEHLHHFMVPGSLSDIPFSGDEANYRGITYRTYSSEKLNLLVWQFAPDMMAILAGHRSAPELAELARLGTPE